MNSNNTLLKDQVKVNTMVNYLAFARFLGNWRVSSLGHLISYYVNQIDEDGIDEELTTSFEKLFNIKEETKHDDVLNPLSIHFGVLKAVGHTSPYLHWYYLFHPLFEELKGLGLLQFLDKDSPVTDQVYHRVFGDKKAKQGAISAENFETSDEIKSIMGSVSSQEEEDAINQHCKLLSIIKS